VIGSSQLLTEKPVPKKKRATGREKTKSYFLSRNYMQNCNKIFFPPSLLVINCGAIGNDEADAEEKKVLPRQKKQNPAPFRVIGGINATKSFFY